MHRFWTIPDMIYLIFLVLSRKDQVRVLRLSRLLWELGGPIYWRSIRLPQLQDLFDIESGELKFKSTEDLQIERFRTYAASVQRFYYFANNPSATTFVDYIVKHGPISNILPDVREIILEVCDRWRDPIDVIRSLKCDKLHTLDILVVIPTTGPGILSALVDIPARLRALTLSDVGLWPAQEVKRLFETQKQLRFLKIRCEASHVMGVWLAASQLPDLQEAYITAYDRVQPELVQADSGGFASLTNLKLVLPTSDTLSFFLKSVASTKLRTLEVGCSTGDVLRAASVGLERFPALASLEVKWNTDMKLGPSTTLSHYTHVTRLVITGLGISTSLDDKALERLTLAFPSLRELKLLEPAPRGSTNRDHPLITLKGMETLARNCLSLRKLVLSVDAQEVPKEFEVKGTALEELNLRTSVGDEDEIERIAQFIAYMWPNHRSHMTTWRAGSPDKALWDKILAEVRRLLVGPK